MAFVALGNTVSISAGPTVSVANIQTATNTFRIINANATAYSYAGVFTNYTDALTLNHPASGSAAGGYGVAIAPTQNETITGNFGPNAITGTVYVAVITSANSGQVVQITPIRAH